MNIWSLHAIRLPPEDRDPAKLAEALKVIERPFKVLDEALAEQAYLVGDDFTVADLNVAAVISRAIEMDLSATPHLGAWLKRCLERPAALEARRLRQMSDDASPADSIRADRADQPPVGGAPQEACCFKNLGATAPAAARRHSRPAPGRPCAGSR